MATGEIKTQGTHLYFVDRTGAATLVKLTCPTGITGLTGGAADQIEDTCLDELTDKTYMPGLNNPATVTVPFNLIPRESSHQRLFELKASKQVLDWIALLSESAAVPTLDAGGNLVAPTTRTSFKFKGYIASVDIDVATNEIVRGTLTIQRSGGVTPTWYTPA